MRLVPKHRRAGALAAMLLLGALVTPPARAQDAPGWWRALYRGSAGGQSVVLDLTLAGQKASGRLLLPARHEVLDASGSAAADGSVTLTLTPPTGRGTASPPAASGSLVGRRSMAPNDDGSRLSGRLQLPGGTVTVALTRIAQDVRVDVLEGAIHARASYPRFLDPALAPLNAELGPPARAGLDTFVREGEHARAANALFHAWELIADTRLEGLAGVYASLETTRYRYTGGAHGNQEIETATWWLDPSGPRRLSLSDLFAPGADYVARLAPLVLAGLRAQDATWVVQGQVTSLTAHDLALYALTPAGMTFTFPPYAMGPYVQGTFTVVVPYARVIDLAAKNGALEAFAKAGG